MESIAIINGVEYTAISAPIIDRALLADNLSVGNCISSTLKLSILTDDVIGKAAKVVIKARITDDVEYSEWLEFGTFYIDNRSIDSGLITVQCYDAMLKASQTYGDETNPEDRIGWPKTMKTCVNEIAARIGVEVDPRTAIKTTAPYQVPYPNKMSMMQVLGYIGACHGGNWVITPENKLRLVPLLSPPAETFNIIDHDYNRIYTGDGHKLVWQHTETGETVEHKAGGGLVNVPVVVGKIATSKPFKVTRVILARDEDLGYALGDDSGYTLIIESNPYACQAICDDLYAELNGLEYNPYTITSACYDPAAELGDWILVGDKVRSVLYSENATLNIDFRVNASAPGKDEVGSEYPYLTSIQRIQMEQEQLKKYTETEKDEIYSKIEQTHTEILLQVAGTYANKDVVNADIEILVGAITAEIKRSTDSDEQFVSSLKLTQDAITSEVSRAQGAEKELSSSITQTASQISLKVSKGDVSSQISVESGAISIGSNRLTINSDNFSLSGNGQVIATGSLSSIKNNLRSTITGAALRFYEDDASVGYLSANAKAGSGIGDGNVYTVMGFVINRDALTMSDGETVHFAYNNGYNPLGVTDRFFLGGTTYIGDDLTMIGRIVFSDAYGNEHSGLSCMDNNYNGYMEYGVLVEGDLCATGALWCGGEKYRVVDTGTYGKRGLNAMESAVSVFSDIGSGTTDDNGECYVFFESVFAETIDLRHDYQVFVSFNCSASSDYRIEKGVDHFVLHAAPGVSFDWITFARQKDFATHRLERVDVESEDRIRIDESVFYGDNIGANETEAYMDEFADTYDQQAEAYLRYYEQEVTTYGN